MSLVGKRIKYSKSKSQGARKASIVTEHIGLIVDKIVIDTNTKYLVETDNDEIMVIVPSFIKKIYW